ncbi:hypothetical protein [Shinella zoogloeoides]|uniref:hypothetical protein n=1 Tax=Shinella zoogloeoides TaxID=352475 RepID=UPI00299E2E91|nr:hypothetical protein [Shinella zoogloeoides]
MQIEFSQLPGTGSGWRLSTVDWSGLACRASVLLDAVADGQTPNAALPRVFHRGLPFNHAAKNHPSDGLLDAHPLPSS